jgi:hypothetical protein
MSTAHLSDEELMMMVPSTEGSVVVDPPVVEEVSVVDVPPEVADAVPVVEAVENTPAAEVVTKELEETTPDYEALYKQVMAPFKANGKTIELKDTSELMQLVQQGANYTRKMQDIAPHRKVLMMLENNGLLDQDKLSYLIDLDKRNPEAIKKLVKDAGINPMEIDTDEASAYQASNHSVSDEEASFRTTLDDLRSAPDGQTTLNLIHNGWDQASKEVLWKNPDILTTIHQQRESGVYDRISTEIERQKMLGVIPPNTPFLHAYKAVGDKLVEANAFADMTPNKAPTAPVAVRAVLPKPVVSNSAQATAASTSRSTPRKAEPLVNPLNASDDEFMLYMSKRV